MAVGFERRRGGVTDLSVNEAFLLGEMQGILDPLQQERITRIRNAWNFYEGFHWEAMPHMDTPELTINYCRTFINKFVSFELGKGISMSVAPEFDKDEVIVTNDGLTLFQFLESVWIANKQETFLTELGQMKSVTGEAWVQIYFFEAGEFEDPFDEFPDGFLKMILLPTSVVFPEYDPHNRDRIERVNILYAYKRQSRNLIGKRTTERVVYRQVWTRDEVLIQDGKDDPQIMPNLYGIIPFVCIKNLTTGARIDGLGDLEDIIPMNVEYNLKTSNVSEIIDYHAAPITIVYGAKVGNLEKGANKMWGGLAKDARVENLSLNSDLGASTNYLNNLKVSMCEIAGIPETVLGGAQAISNTSGVALEYLNLPLIEKTRQKKALTENGLELLNKIILFIALQENLVFIPEGVERKRFFYNEVTVLDTLPKDKLIELQQIQQEMTMGLESRPNAMKRLGKENIDELIQKIDEDINNNPEIYGRQPKINSGMMNGETTGEVVSQRLAGTIADLRA